MLNGKESACQYETLVQSLGQEDPLVKEMATHSSILAWEIQWTWILSLGWEDLQEEGMVTHPSRLTWRISMDRGAWQATQSMRS